MWHHVTLCDTLWHEHHKVQVSDTLYFISYVTLKSNSMHDKTNTVLQCQPVTKILEGILCPQVDTKPVCAEYIDVTLVWETHCCLYHFNTCQYQPEHLLFKHDVCEMVCIIIGRSRYSQPSIWTQFGLAKTHCGQLWYAPSQASQPGRPGSVSMCSTTQVEGGRCWGGGEEIR